jgi:hypothetical protein
MTWTEFMTLSPEEFMKRFRKHQELSLQQTAPITKAQEASKQLSKFLPPALPGLRPVQIIEIGYLQDDDGAITNVVVAAAWNDMIWATTITLDQCANYAKGLPVTLNLGGNLISV